MIAVESNVQSTIRVKVRLVCLLVVSRQHSKARRDFFKILCFCKSPTQSEFCNYLCITIAFRTTILQPDRWLPAANTLRLLQYS